MSFEIDCAIRLRKGDEVIVDAQRAKLLEKVVEMGSLEQAANELGISPQQAEIWLDAMQKAADSPIVSSPAGGTVAMTDAGRALLSEFETRSRLAESQVQNLWKKPWITTDGIVVMGGQVVLIKRGREPFKGMYALPGGIVEYGERVEDCVVREIEEETGLKTRVLDLVGVYSAPARDPRGHFITLAFNLTPIGGQLNGGDDAAEATLFPLDSLPPMASDHILILSDALLKRDQRRSAITKHLSEMKL
jgi:8-oxo-dGTP diphosphatase